MRDFFKLRENGTNVRTEVIAGLTSFMTMAYIIALNPNLLTNFGAEGQELWNGVFLATCIASAIGTVCMGLLANKPFVMAPGMGLNSFFAVVVSNIAAMTGFTYLQSFQSALVIILVEGILFLVLSVLNIREKIVDAIPLGIRLGIGPSIGLMLMNIGVGSNVGIYSETGGPFYVMRDFFGALTATYGKTQMGTGHEPMLLAVVTMFFGLFVIIALNHRKVKGSVLYGMLAASVLYWIGEAVVLGTNPFESLKTASFVPAFGDMATIGTLVGTASRANMVDENGNMPNMRQALVSDAVGTVAGALTGTSTVTTFVESASGVEAGGRTGLTAITAAILFLLCMFIAPIAAVIPAAATSSALIYVGILMLSNLKKIDFDDISQMAPVGIMLLAMPISGSIGHGIGLALIAYTVIQCCTGKAKKVSVLTYILSAIFLIKFFVAL